MRDRCTYAGKQRALRRHGGVDGAPGTRHGTGGTRVDAALEAWRAGKAQNIIVCGAQGRDEPRTEAEAMAEKKA